jgi:hypothetical protein
MTVPLASSMGEAASVNSRGESQKMQKDHLSQPLTSVLPSKYNVNLTP